jgi:phage tail tape-measure protein
LRQLLDVSTKAQESGEAYVLLAATKAAAANRIAEASR